MTSPESSQSTQISLTKGEDLSDDDRAAWTALQSANPQLANPFFRIEYVEELARLCPNVRVAIARREGGPVAFWPFQLSKSGIARPVGGKIDSMQAVICAADESVNGPELASACGVNAWRFTHQLASQSVFKPWFYEVLESPFIDVSGGFDAYCQRRKDAGHTNKAIRTALSRQRKLEREKGALHFNPDCRDLDVLHKMIEWKRAQMRETGALDVFRKFPWVIPFLENVLNRPDDNFRGMLSVLTINEQPAAIQFGLRSGPVLHGMFLSYAREFSWYSPGAVMLIMLVQQAAACGIDRLEMGKGREDYKQTFKSGSTGVAVGSMDLRPVSAFVRSRAYDIRRRLIHSPLGDPLRSASRLARRLVNP